jgi:ribosomal protein S18 acetylase RimI-like enzyme
MPARGIRVLLDSNIIIAHEAPAAAPDAHTNSARELLGILRGLGCSILISAGSVADFAKAPVDLRAERRRTLWLHYEVLDPVQPTPELRAAFPAQALSSNDEADLQVLAAYATGVADWLITQDVKLVNRAKAAGLSDVFSAEEAIQWLTPWLTPNLPNAVAASMVAPYSINLRSRFFDSLRADYTGFDAWWRAKVVREDRHTIVIGDPQDPDGLAVLKSETDNPHGLGTDVLKICTFKIAESSQQARLGELLLRAVIDYATEQRLPISYLTAYPSKQPLIDWLNHFGFAEITRHSDGEIVLAKHLIPPYGAPPLAPLEFAIKYGPRNMRVERAHVVPIRRTYHRRIFPDSQVQVSLFENEPCGNAIRKAYLCRASTRKLYPGDALLFLQTGDGPARVDTIGAVESTLVSRDPAEIVTFVRNRTVYGIQEIRNFCTRGEVLSIRFRLDRSLRPGWTVKQLKDAAVMTRSPQSIAMVPERGVQWVRHQLGG